MAEYTECCLHCGCTMFAATCHVQPWYMACCMAGLLLSMSGSLLHSHTVHTVVAMCLCFSLQLLEHMEAEVHLYDYVSLDIDTIISGNALDKGVCLVSAVIFTAHLLCC